MAPSVRAAGPRRFIPPQGQWCGCDGQTFGGSLPSRRWRFADSCAVRVLIEGTTDRAALDGRPASQTLVFSMGPDPESRPAGSPVDNHRLGLGAFEGTCRQVPVRAPTLLRVVWGDPGSQRELIVARQGADVVLTQYVNADGHPSPPQPPPQITVRFGAIPTSYAQPGHAPTLSVELYHPLASFVGYLPPPCVDRPATAPTILHIACGAGAAALVDLTVQHQGDTLILSRSDGVNGQPHEIRRIELPAGAWILPAPLRRD